jgi:hypothetical protein
MGNSAIVAKLQLDSKDYDKKLAEAKKKTRDFSQGGGTNVAALMSKFQALAGAVAACKAAQEVFNATIKSSQTIGDAYTIVISQARGAVDEFVYAMANADFSGFNDGLKGIFRNAKEAAQAMDSLGNAQISFDYLTAGYRSAFKTGIGTAKDKSLSLAERQAGYDAAQAALGEIKGAVDVYTDKVTQAVVNNAAAKGNNINKDFITRENIDRVFKLDLSANGEAEKKALADRYKEFKKLKDDEEKLEKAVARARLNGYDSEAQYAQKLAEVRAKINSDDMQMAALYNAMLVKGTDEWLKGLADLVIKADNANAQYQELKTSSLEVATALGLAANEAAKLDAAARHGQGYTNKAVPMAGLPTGAGVTLSGKIESPIEVDTTAVENYYAALETLDSVSVSASEGMGALGSAVANLGGLLGEGGAAWGNYASGIMSAIGQAIPTIEALATAQAAAAAAGAALSPWNVVATVAAVSSVIAAMSQIPKFATGGVVPGNRLSGDNVLIRANSGEVVLTKAQAHNIGSMLSGGMGGKVVFKIEGSTLVGVLNNHNRIAARSYGYKNG